MKHLEVSGAVRHIYVFRQLRVNGRFSLHVTFPFRRGTSPFSKVFSFVIKWKCSY